MAHTKGRSSRCAFQPRPKKKAPPPPPPRAVKAPLPTGLFAHYQLLLRVFASTFAAELADRDDLQTSIQDVKKALFERDFAAAFESEDALLSYAARWSPTRALCYAGVLAGVDMTERREQRSAEDGDDDGDDDEEEKEGQQEQQQEEGEADENDLHIVAIGGGPAELAAYASLRTLHPQRTGSLTLIDSAPWSTVLTRLQAGLSTPPQLSKYASASAHAANAALMTPAAVASLGVVFRQADVLELSADALRSAVFPGGGVPRKTLVTLLFTLNELYAEARGKTTLLLLALGEMLPVGSALLVLDSPGSYSEAAVGKDMRRYPMRLLVEHTLLREERGVQKEKEWVQVETEDSVWFRLPEGLEYPIQLENMRYQKHLYKLVKPEKRVMPSK